MTKYARELTRLAFPIMVGQVGVMLIGVGDVYVASQYSPLALAAIGVAVNFINPFLLFGLGLMFGLSSLVAIRKGEGKEQAGDLKTLLLYWLLVSILVLLISLPSIHLVDLVGLNPKIIPLVKAYLELVVYSFPFALFYQVVKEYLQAQERVLYANWVGIACAALNIWLNFQLVYGSDIFPELGFMGLAYASFFIRLAMALLMIPPIMKLIPMGRVSKSFLKRTLNFNLPIACMVTLEVTGFCLFAVLAGKFGVVEAATNNLILTIASLTFMVPLSIAGAASTKVGRAFGARKMQDIIGFTRVALIFSASFMICTGCLYGFYPEIVMNLFAQDAEIRKLGISLLAIVALFQVVDGIQVTLGGILEESTKIKKPSSEY